jgi:hypothetical protein
MENDAKQRIERCERRLAAHDIEAARHEIRLGSVEEQVKTHWIVLRGKDGRNGLETRMRSVEDCVKHMADERREAIKARRAASWTLLVRLVEAAIVATVALWWAVSHSSEAQG